MADAEAEKAEKLAAAKKRFEQLKKEQAKKTKKTGKKKSDKEAAGDAKPDDVVGSAQVEDAGDATTTVDDKTTVADDAQADGEEDVSEKSELERQPSLPIQSKQRSESFRQGGAGPGAEVQDLYKKQAARIEELEKESKAYREQQEEGATRLAKVEEELESVREEGSDAAELRSKAKEADKLKDELAGVQRQLAQAQTAAKGSNRRMSTVTPNHSQELASKTSAMESLELELSTIRNQLLSLQSTMSERDTAIKDLEERSKMADSTTETYRQELEQLKVSMAFPSDETIAAKEDPEALTKRITVLESDLRTANSNLDTAQQRAITLEQKIEALTKLHRDATNTSNVKDKELTDLRNQLRRRERGSHVRDASEFELLEEETETGALQARIRALEAETFDLRRGVWRDKRVEIQPGMEDQGQDYEDVDLTNGSYNGSASTRNRLGSIPRQHSNFQDIITSGISAFTGRPREASSTQQQRERGQSLGLLDDDNDEVFDADAFRLAQEQEAKRRLERVREAKRGLEGWRGWRVDLMEGREVDGGYGGGGAVFEV
ncbi:hypothetical protein LTR78_006627 [Recurvomyces mirabilis]|uniref:M protein repeat protein n=1 Tax=Recurvomyces mirabilis TaxID=574656 RepID=A0AAE0WKH9_9PEZI|nr:hypothetical protein LTR78_006627 [Recurvomyces mirabilis]KAK5151482.1 hypothetical protein LTS14_009326 [Recurvomyces mirabilis]